MKETQKTPSNASLPPVLQLTSNNDLNNLYGLLVPNRMINSWPQENNAPSNDDILELGPNIWICNIRNGSVRANSEMPLKKQQHPLHTR